MGMRSKAKLNKKLATALSKKVKGYLSGGKNTAADEPADHNPQQPSRSSSSSAQVHKLRGRATRRVEKAPKSKRAKDIDSDSCSKEEAWSGDSDSENQSKADKKNDRGVRGLRSRSPAKQTATARDAKKVVVPSSRTSRVQRSFQKRTFERPTSVQVKMTKVRLKPPPSLEQKKNKTGIKAHLREVLKDKPLGQERRSSVQPALPSLKKSRIVVEKKQVPCLIVIQKKNLIQSKPIASAEAKVDAKSKHIPEKAATSSKTEERPKLKLQKQISPSPQPKTPDKTLQKVTERHQQKPKSEKQKEPKPKQRPERTKLESESDQSAESQVGSQSEPEKPTKVKPVVRIKRVAEPANPVPEPERKETSESSERRETLKTSSGDVLISRIDDEDCQEQNPFVQLQINDKDNTADGNSLDSATDGLNRQSQSLQQKEEQELTNTDHELAADHDKKMVETRSGKRRRQGGLPRMLYELGAGFPQTKRKKVDDKRSLYQRVMDEAIEFNQGLNEGRTLLMSHQSDYFERKLEKRKYIDKSCEFLKMDYVLGPRFIQSMNRPRMLEPDYRESQDSELLREAAKNQITPLKEMPAKEQKPLDTTQDALDVKPLPSLAAPWESTAKPTPSPNNNIPITVGQAQLIERKGISLAHDNPTLVQAHTKGVLEPLHAGHIVQVARQTLVRVLHKDHKTNLYQCPECFLAVLFNSFVQYTSRCRTCQDKAKAIELGNAYKINKYPKYNWVTGVPKDDQDKYLHDESLRKEINAQSLVKRAQEQEEIKALKATKVEEQVALAAAQRAKMMSLIENSSLVQSVNPYLIGKEPAELGSRVAGATTAQQGEDKTKAEAKKAMLSQYLSTLGNHLQKQQSRAQVQPAHAQLQNPITQLYAQAQSVQQSSNKPQQSVAVRSSSQQRTPIHAIQAQINKMIVQQPINPAESKPQMPHQVPHKVPSQVPSQVPIEVSSKQQENYQAQVQQSTTSSNQGPQKHVSTMDYMQRQMAQFQQYQMEQMQYQYQMQLYQYQQAMQMQQANFGIVPQQQYEYYSAEYQHPTDAQYQNQQYQQLMAAQAYATQVQTPQAQTPQAQTPQVQTPQAQTPQVQTPQVQTSQVQTPQVQSPKVQSLQFQVPQVQSHHVQSHQVQEPHKVDQTPTQNLQAMQMQTGQAQQAQQVHQQAGLTAKNVVVTADKRQPQENTGVKPQLSATVTPADFQSHLAHAQLLHQQRAFLQPKATSSGLMARVASQDQRDVLNELRNVCIGGGAETPSTDSPNFTQVPATGLKQDGLTTNPTSLP